MWGNLVTETAFLNNFTLGFPTKQSDILLHLTHWQYWFWFWFTYYMVLYYFIFLRLIRYRVMKMSPRLSTTFRSHGKWGDLLVCFIPLSWCTNILSNSNFILRMIEWQSESSLFTLRVRGKQWYWVYKFELKSLTDISNTSFNIGNNFWSNKVQTQDHQHLGFTQLKHNLANSHSGWSLSGAKQHTNNVELFSTSVNSAPLSYNSPLHTAAQFAEPTSNLQSTNGYLLSHNYAWSSACTNIKPLIIKTSELTLSSQSSNFSTISPEVTRLEKLSSSTHTPIRLIKTASGTGVDVKYPSTNSFIKKPTSSNFYLVVKQKRYLPSSMSSNKYILNNTNAFTPNEFAPVEIRDFAQHAASRNEIMSLQSNRRLLRTRRVLVLPAHTNITLITNSFDVMHSWYIPGLGVKLDCVPGRSTHHTIHIDHAGFYYGQCAEICGRYHHHMPIRVCALPFEHFLIWWYHYGAPFFLAGNQNRAKFISNTAKQINW